MNNSVLKGVLDDNMHFLDAQILVLPKATIYFSKTYCIPLFGHSTVWEVCC
jgi:hypothetical protein